MIKFKNEKDIKLFHCLHPALILIFADLNNYAFEKYGINLTVTQTISTIEEDIALNRVSNSHLECRAIDIRTKDIDAFIISDLVQYINGKLEYQKYRYMSNGGKSRLAYFHVGNEEHIHLAIHSKFKISP